MTCFYKLNNHHCPLPKKFFEVCKYCFKYDICDCERKPKDRW